MRHTIKVHLQLMRLSNAPTILSNVLVGVAIGAASGGSMNWSAAAMVTLGLLLLYAGGMIMNDIVDLRRDRRDKPDRPIASGRVSARYATLLMCGCLAAGVLLVALAGMIAAGFDVRGMAAAGWTVLLLMAIVGYNLSHRKTVLSVLPMGACRGLVYLVAAAAIAGGAGIDWRLALPPTIAMTAFIIALTLAARAEAGNDAALGRRLSIIMILIALAPSLVVAPAATTPSIVAGLAVIGWLVLTQRHVMTTPPRVGEAVHGWLAAICLIDGLYVCLLGAPELAVIAWACFAATTLSHRVVAGT